MFGVIFIHEIQNYLYSLRFQLSFIIVLIVFVTGSISFVSSYKEVRKQYLTYNNEQQKVLEMKSANVSDVATSTSHYVMSPRENGFISDCKEEVLPNQFNYSAYNVSGFSIRHNTMNPLMKQAQPLNWSFIMSMILSFFALLFSFDAISGEKEDRTLALMLSNKVSRATILLAKFASVVVTILAMAVTGMIISLLITSFTGTIHAGKELLLETLGFLGISLLFIAATTIIGLLSSVLTRHSNVSLLISLCFWLAFAVIIPNTSVFWANILFPIPSVDKINQQIKEGRDALNKAAPDDSWSAHGGEPFYPAHELRANLQMKLMLNEKQFKDNYYIQMFYQFENTRYLAMLSPIAQFDYMNEAMLGGGYLRFRKNWYDLQIYQSQFLHWFKDIDMKDSNSPHWYNPYENFSTSQQSISVDQIPVYEEKSAGFSQRIKYMLASLITLSLTIIVGFAICFTLLTKYDVR